MKNEMVCENDKSIYVGYFLCYIRDTLCCSIWEIFIGDTIV